MLIIFDRFAASPDAKRYLSDTQGSLVAGRDSDDPVHL